MVDYFKSNGNFSNFFSKNFLEIEDNFSEILFLLSAIDLPFESIKCKTQLENDILNVSVSTRLIILTKEIIEEEGIKSE